MEIQNMKIEGMHANNALEKMGLKGFFKLEIGQEKNGKIDIVGKTKADDGSEWLPNQIVNLGWQDYIFACIGAVSGSKQVGRLILGTGGAPASNATALAGETTRSASINAATVGSFTLRFTTQFASGDHPGGTPSIANMALINNTASGGTILCGNTFSSSQWWTNQGVSMTYELRKA